MTIDLSFEVEAIAARIVLFFEGGHFCLMRLFEQGFEKWRKELEYRFKSSQRKHQLMGILATDD